MLLLLLAGSRGGRNRRALVERRLLALLGARGDNDGHLHGNVGRVVVVVVVVRVRVVRVILVRVVDHNRGGRGERRGQAVRNHGVFVAGSLLLRAGCNWFSWFGGEASGWRSALLLFMSIAIGFNLQTLNSSRLARRV